MPWPLQMRSGGGIGQGFALQVKLFAETVTAERIAVSTVKMEEVKSILTVW